MSSSKHIGIVACSAEGASLCYRTICVEGGEEHPEVSMHTQTYAAYVASIERGDWNGVAELMLDSARKLARSGAEFLICPDNTLHQALPLLAPRSPLPWLSIADVVIANARERGFRRVGLTGTRWLVASDVYPPDYVRATERDRDEIHRIITHELVRGVFDAESIAYLLRVIASMQRAGCDAVVLGCTELPLVINDANSPLPVLDSTRLLARAALERA